MPDDITRFLKQRFLDISGFFPDVNVFDHVDVFTREQPVSIGWMGLAFLPMEISC
jgi:hypothetical protein